MAALMLQSEVNGLAQGLLDSRFAESIVLIMYLQQPYFPQLGFNRM